MKRTVIYWQNVSLISFVLTHIRPKYPFISVRSCILQQVLHNTWKHGNKLEDLSEILLTWNFVQLYFVHLWHHLSHQVIRYFFMIFDYFFLSYRVNVLCICQMNSDIITRDYIFRLYYRRRQHQGSSLGQVF